MKCFRKMLALGSSKPWPDALEIITGQRKMEASALVEYFKPLQDWLEKKNKETGAHIGWDSEFGIVFIWRNFLFVTITNLFAFLQNAYLKPMKHEKIEFKLKRCGFA